MKNFNFYFKKGLILAKMALKGKSIFTKLLLGLYLILSFIGKLFFFTRPIFLIADNNLAMMIVEGHDFELNKLFEGVNSKNRYSSLLLANIFVEGIALAAAVIFVVPFLVWGLMPNLYNYQVSPFIFVSVFGVAASILLVALLIIYAPMGYIATKGKDLNAGDILFLSKEGSANAKGKILGINLLNYLFILLILGALIGGAIIVANIMRDEYSVVLLAANFIIMGIFIVLIFVDLFLLPIFKMAILISQYALFFDNVQAKHIVVATKGSSSNEYVPIFSDDKEVK